MSDQRPRRLAALLDGLTGAHVDGLLVTSLANVRYLTGFSGSSALLLVSQRETLLITDFRYQTQAADEVGAEQYFPAGNGVPVIDDHIPFLEQGVPSIDLIDFTYKYADGLQDTPDKLDTAALDAVGETVSQLVIDLSGGGPQS